MSRAHLFRYKLRGRPLRIVIGHTDTMSLAGARARKLRMRRALDDGIDPRRAWPRRRPAPAPLSISAATAAPDVQHTVEFLASEFLTRYVRPTRKRPEYAEAILQRDVLSVWKGRDARTIQPAEVIELLDGIVDRGSRVIANRTAALLGQMFRFGIHRHIVPNTPVQLLIRPGGKEKPRERTLTDDEPRVFLKDPKSCTRFDRLSHVVLVLLLTGQRRGELALARWSEIDFTAKTRKIPDEHAKAGRGHIVPLAIGRSRSSKPCSALRSAHNGCCRRMAASITSTRNSSHARSRSAGSDSRSAASERSRCTTCVGPAGRASRD